MLYTIYQTTNLINGKRYIGKHVTENLNDDYIGSGIVLAKSIKKYGRENFKKETLFVFDNEEDMNAKEVEIVNEDVILNDDYYNIALGGRGGSIVLMQGHPLYDSTRQKISEAQLRRRDDMSRITSENHKHKRVGMYGKQQSSYQKQVVSALMKGVSKSPESVAKQRESAKKTFEDPSYVHPNKGKRYDADRLKQMSNISSTRPKKTCPHCNTVMDERNYARYHGDNCKHK